MIGVWQAGKGEVGAAVKAALDAGYRHIDGAWRYAVSLRDHLVSQSFKLHVLHSFGRRAQSTIFPACALTTKCIEYPDAIHGA